MARKATQVAGTIEERLSDEAKVKAVATPRTGTTADELTTIDVRFENEADAEKLDPKFVRSFLPDYAIVSRNGAESTLQMQEAAIDGFRRDALDQAIETIERRINAFGVAESTISRRGETDLVVQLPGVKEEDFAAAKAKLAQTGQLHFQIVDETSAANKFFTSLSEKKPTDANWPEGIAKDHKVVVSGNSAISTSRELLEHMASGLVDREHLIGFQEAFVNPNDPNLRTV